MSYYQITLLVTEEQENAIVDLFATRRWIYMKTGSSSSHTNFYRGHENGAVPFIDIQAQEHFDNRCKSQEKRCESSSDNSHDVMKPDVTANINKRKHEEHRSCIRKSELSSGNISPFCNSGIKNKSEGEEEKDSFTQEPEMEVEPCKKYESLEVLSKSNISMASLFRIVNSISNLDTADQNTSGPQTNDSRYTSDLKEDQAVETDIAIHTGDKFKGHGKAATPFDSTESGTRTLQAQEMFENMSQEQINNPRLDILHAGIKPDDVAYGNTSDGLTINIIDSPIERCCKASESKNNLLGVCSENPWQHQTSKIVKSMHIKKNHDIESRTKTRSYCNNEILSTSKRDGIESSKQQDSKEMESSKQQEPEKTESYKQQESEDKQQQHEETASYKRKTRSEISSYEKICSKEELFKSSKPSVLGAIINDNFCQYIDTKEINLPERIDTTATSEPERKSEVENIAELKTCRKAKITKYVNIYCMFCEHTFKTQKRYYDHLKYDRCRHECEICGKIFLHETTHNYKKHLGSHNQQRDQECQTCGKLFIGRSSLLYHVKLHADPKPIICEICGLGFQNRQILRLHKNNKHNDKREKSMCPKCPKMFMSSSGLDYHLRTKHDEDNNFKFPCNICNKVCKDKKQLNSHSVSHRETRNFKCDTCTAAFKRVSTLNQHKKRHRKAFVLFCQYCQKGCYTSQHLMEHENTHTGARPYLCTFCDYTCANKGNQSKHEKHVHKNRHLSSKSPE